MATYSDTPRGLVGYDEFDITYDRPRIATVALLMCVTGGVLFGAHASWQFMGNAVAATALTLLAVTGPQRLWRQTAYFAIAFGLVTVLPSFLLPAFGAVVVLITAEKFPRANYWTPHVTWLTVALSLGSIVGVGYWWHRFDGFIWLSGLASTLLTYPALAIALVGVGAAANAIFEEGLWRRTLANHLSGCGAWLTRTVFLAACFGFMHFHAIHTPWLLAILAAVFGFVASCIVELSGGRLLPVIIAHFIADIALVAMYWTI